MNGTENLNLFDWKRIENNWLEKNTIDILFKIIKILKTIIINYIYTYGNDDAEKWKWYW